MSANSLVDHFCSLELDGVDSKIVINDLQSLFKKSIGENVKVIHYRTSRLIPWEEHYGSRVSKMIACIKSEDSTIQKLSLMAKMNHASQFQKRFINSTAAFSKEIFFYETLIPAYEKLYCNEDKLKIFPKYYGGRLTRSRINPDVADDDAILLTEDLKVHEYCSVNKYYGLDFDHAKMAITSLARFHALGMTVKEKNPKLFNDAKKLCNIKCKFSAKNTSKIIDYVLVDKVCTPKFDNPLIKYKKKIKSNMKKNNWNAWLSPRKKVKPWVTIIHGDFCINNILFHDTIEGDVDDAKITDFQWAKIGSPQADLVYFLCGSLDFGTLENHFDELIDVYYDKFIQTLHTTGAYTTELSKESFYQGLKKVARTELFHCMMGIKFFTSTVEIDIDDIETIMQFRNTDELFENRASMVVLKFIEKKWL